MNRMLSQQKYNFIDMVINKLIAERQVEFQLSPIQLAQVRTALYEVLESDWDVSPAYYPKVDEEVKLYKSGQLLGTGRVRVIKKPSSLFSIGDITVINSYNSSPAHIQLLDPEHLQKYLSTKYQVLSTESTGTLYCLIENSMGIWCEAYGNDVVVEKFK